jgi:hypothetical protein
MPEARDDFSEVELFFSGVIAGLSFVLDIDFHKNVFPTSSEKLITPVDGLI